MTDQAAIHLPLELWFAFLLLLKGVENCPQLRINCGEFKHIARMAITNIDIIVEINGPGSFRCDMTKLKTGFGEHQSLGFDWNIQSFE